MRKLASIQKIVDIQPMEGCDSIEMVQVLGWNCIVAKSEGYKIGDLVLYFEIDSIIPEYMREELSFMSRTNWRVRTIRMRGYVSQGVVVSIKTYIKLHNIVFPYPCFSLPVYEDLDVTDELQITKYEAPEGVNAGQSAGNFISNVPKTDETRIQEFSDGVLDLLKEIDDQWVASYKVDGSSTTYSLQDNEFKVCSHRLQRKKPEGDYKCDFWDVAMKYGVEEKMRLASEKFGLVDWSLQGELCGGGIQKNRQKFKEKSLRFFYIFDETKQQYLEHDKFKEVMSFMELPTVPFYSEDFDLKSHDRKSLLELVDNITYPETNAENEGLVFYTKHNHNILRRSSFGRVSFKVVSNKYLGKEKD